MTRIPRWLGPVLVAIGGTMLLGAVVWKYSGTAFDRSLSKSADREPTAAAPDAANRLVLSRDKCDAVRLSTAVAERVEIQTKVIVPGRLQYDDARYIEIQSASEGVLEEVRVKPGDQVVAGQVLAVLESPEVGNARADVLRLEADLDLEREHASWLDAVDEGLARLLNAVEAKRSLEQIRREFHEVKLGSHREAVIDSYARRALAETSLRAGEKAAASGSLAGKALQERIREYESASAALETVLEQSRHDAHHDRMQASGSVRDVERRLEISRHHLATLLGHDESVSREDHIPMHQLSRIEVRAPIPGTIEERRCSAAERAHAGDTLFVLANTQTLWVAADLREQVWSSVQIQPGQTISVTCPAAARRQLPATVHYIGRQVDPGTNAVPLIATLDNSDQRLRPGMFVQVSLPAGTPRQVLVVPSSAVTTHEGKKFVFTPVGAGEFRRVEIEAGLENQGRIEITRGLDAGVVVVSHGVFELKSELLLEKESE